MAHIRKDRSSYSLFEQAVERTPDTTAVVDLETGDRLTYRKLAERVRQVANGFRELGIEHGDRVAVCLRNRPEHVIVFLATQAIGAVEVPFNFRLARDGIRYTLTDADPSLLVYGDDSADHVAALQETLSLDEYVAVADRPEDTPEFAVPFRSVATAPAKPLQVEVAGTDRSVIQYSSGTTGDPKGIEITHEGTVARTLVDAFGQQFRMEEEVMLGAMPLYHTVGLHGILLTMLAVSGTYVSMPVFDPERAVRAIEQEGVTAFHEAPTIFSKLLDTAAIDDTDTGSVRVVTYSGAPMSTSLLDRLTETLDPEFISNQYGCTEAYAPLSQFNLREGGQPTEAGGANLLQHVRIVELGATDPDAEVDRGREGELIVHTGAPTTFSGYWQKPAATAESVYGGWFFTGDVAYQTPAGRTVITGRADDMIISGGENIAPTDVEDVLATHDAVVDVAVIGVPDEEWGEVPKAYVVPEETAAVDAADLDSWCLASDSLPDFKRPRAYELVTELPRNPSGKVKRYVLREREGTE
jgi:2-furoate---CoA ligase